MPRPRAGGQPRTSPFVPSSTPRKATRRRCSSSCCTGAVRLILSGDHGPLRRAMAAVGAQAAAADPWLSLVSALTHLEVGEAAAAQGNLRYAQQFWPAQEAEELRVLRAVVEH